MLTSPQAACAGFVLTGGRSSRMGKEKALLEINGTPLVVRTVDLLQRVCSSVTIVGRPERYAAFGYAGIADEQADSGPLAGILAALTATASPWNVIVAVDMPYLSDEWLSYLISRARASPAQVVMPVSREGPEPLCAVYHRNAAAPIREAMGRGVLKVTRALEALAIERIEPDEIEPFDLRGLLFQNLNAPEDYERARADLG